MADAPDLSHPLNKVLPHLLGRGEVERAGPPSAFGDPYMELGTHPDVVERLWDALGGGLPVDCRWVAFGVPVLVRPDVGVIFAMGLGTGYGIRLPGDIYEKALAEGATTTHEHSTGDQIDLRDYGVGWVFGGWNDEEGAWCRAAFDYDWPDN